MKVIGIGASAGGVEAILELFQNIPSNTGAAFVVIQHLAPNQKSSMNELLGRQTNMEVQVITEDVDLEANIIYLMSGDYNISLQENTILLVPRPEDTVLNLPIDDFFHSLGKEKKTDAIAVILSGSGSDGSRGIRTVKEQGGLVLVQDPDSAQFDGMPATAIRMNIADSVFPPKKIASQITHITTARHADPSTEFGMLKEGEYNYYFERILQQIRTQVSISFKEYRESTLMRRMEKRMLVHQFDNLKTYYEYLLTDEQEVTALYQDFLIGVTRFFRNSEVFDYFKEHIIEQLVRNSEPDSTIRIWIAACSTGEEAYSFAILIEDYLTKNNLNRDYKIFASDVDKAAIRFASEGLYGSGIAADLPKEYLDKYFTIQGSHLQISKTLQDRILFAYQDVLSDPPFIRMNFISCRNFLIYLKSKTQRKVITNFHFALNEEGVMLLGPSESLGGLGHAFNVAHKKFNFFIRKKGVKLFFRSPYRGSSNQIDTNRSIISQAKTSSTSSEQQKQGQLDPFSRYLIEHLSSITLFLNNDLDILYLNGNVEVFLNLPRTIARLNINNMTSAENAAIFSDGVERAYRGNTATSFSNVSLKKNNEVTVCNIRFRRVTLEGWSNDVILVELKIVTSEERNTPDEDTINQNDFLLDQIRQLEKELFASRGEVKHLRNEIEATTEELQASNRELMASNEELQSTNEELQSVNEELFTVNSEFQIKNQELTIANADINNLLKSTEIGTIFLDHELRIRKFTPAIQQQFKLLTSDIGRLITDFSSAFLDLKIADACQQVSKTGKPLERAVSDQNNNQYLMRVLPYRTIDFLTKGFVITFVNVNELEALQNNLISHAKVFNSWFDTSPNTILLLNDHFTIVDINRDLGSSTINELKDSNFKVLIASTDKAKIQQLFREATQKNVSNSMVTTINQQKYLLTVIPITDPSSSFNVAFLVILASDNN